MIGKIIKGNGFRGALEYDLGKDGGRLIASNMAGTTPRELAMEFGAVRRVRPNLRKAVLHVSLAACPGDRLSQGKRSAPLAPMRGRTSGSKSFTPRPQGVRGVCRWCGRLTCCASRDAWWGLA